jgi:hypothetical protein
MKADLHDENILFKMSTDELTTVLSYLWFQDIFCTFKTCRYLCYSIEENAHFFAELFLNLLLKSSPTLNNVKVSTTKLSELTRFAARFVHWPTDIDTSYFSDVGFEEYQLKVIPVSGQRSTCVAYQGEFQGANRSFVANDHFPVLLGHRTSSDSEASIRQVSAVPFCKILSDNDGILIPVLSCVAYFEVTIHPAVQPQAINSDITNHINLHPDINNGVVSCVSVGIARPLFQLTELMPGWDYHSYGLHGDDGLVFHGKSTHGVEFTKDPTQACFGEGDVVGCGVIYPPLLYFTHDPGFSERLGRLFFTKNGAFLGSIPLTDSYFFQHAWFPCVGTDAYNPIEMNLGNTGVPFAFDVMAYERQCFDNWRRLIDSHLSHDGIDIASSSSAPPDWASFSDDELCASVTRYGSYHWEGDFPSCPAFRDPYHVDRGVRESTFKSGHFL